MKFDQYVNHSVYFCSENTRRQYMERCERRGWFPAEILITWIYYDENRTTIVPWLNENCKGRWDYRHACDWEFELVEDAILFKLTWVDK